MLSQPSRAVVTRGRPGAAAKVMQRDSEVTVPHPLVEVTLKHWLPADWLSLTEAVFWLVVCPETIQLQLLAELLPKLLLIMQPLA